MERIIIGLSSIAIAIGLLAGAGWYVYKLKSDLEISIRDTQTLSDAVIEQQKTIAKLELDQAAIRKATNDIANKTIAQDKEVAALAKKFTTSANSSQRDFGQIAAAKPGLVQKAVNAGVVEASRCLEIASGAPLTETEKNATTITEINKACPSMANPAYTPASR